jgi:molybdopterin-binding protein
VLTKTQNTNSARNILQGTVLKITDDGINSTIKIDCGSGDMIYAKVTTSSCIKLNIEVGNTVFASFKAYSINII